MLLKWMRNPLNLKWHHTHISLNNNKTKNKFTSLQFISLDTDMNSRVAAIKGLSMYFSEDWRLAKFGDF